jgi:hypothetical protein
MLHPNLSVTSEVGSRSNSDFLRLTLHQRQQIRLKMYFRALPI